MPMNVENFVDRNYTEDDVYGDVEGDGLYLLVHPGFGLQNDEYKDLGIGEDLYFQYSMDLWIELEEIIDSSYDMAVLQEVETDYSREFLGVYAEDVDHWFKTQRGKSKLLYSDADKFIDLVTSLDEGSIMIISGEHRNLCEGQARQIVNFLSAEKDLSIDLERGVTFPDRPLERDENKNLRFA